MQLKDVALANLKVRKIKICFLLLGIMLALGTIVSLYTVINSLQAQLEEQLERIGVRFLITPPAETVSFSYNGIAVGNSSAGQQLTLPQGTFERVKDLGIQGLEVVSPKLVMAAQLNGSNVLLNGIKLQQELELKSWWDIKEGRLPEGEDELLLGAKGAAQTGLKVGERAIILGREFTVAGILDQSGQPEDRLIFLDLEVLQKLADQEDVSFIELRFRVEEKDEAAEALIAGYASQLKEKLPDLRVVRIKDENLSRQEVIEQFARFASMVAVVVFIIGWLIMAITMMSSVNERSREIGVLRAIGYRKSHIMKIIIMEAAIISALGGVAGYLSGFGIGIAVLPFLSGSSSALAWGPLEPLVVLTVTMLIGLTAAIYPAYKATVLDPVEALRQV